MRQAKLERLEKWLWSGATVVATALAVLLVANLSLGDKHIDTQVDALYAAADAQFRRNVNVMFGPALVGGNRTQALVNGEVFFADMLEAIRGASWLDASRLPTRGLKPAAWQAAMVESYMPVPGGP